MVPYNLNDIVHICRTRLRRAILYGGINSSVDTSIRSDALSNYLVCNKLNIIICTGETYLVDYNKQEKGSDFIENTRDTITFLYPKILKVG
jgi:hypothetical protein